ncbi:CPBP family intramembrane metalloprotease [Rossellomorea aquimaris]|uniref:CPBP family intramembrane glutamic endopeptidase n=1 Tax=Rossellomorea aquimaris TaxID=189382 RepID=UPI001CD57015|nr:type II CAAX endopeptidase family protein [Rossellomorea aquimaris]MCA1056955.1 CPBP family intramembrane metalloprotease [Rossellomorea aquimaris]
MKKHFGYILIAYIVMQLSSIVGIPLLMKIGTDVLGNPEEQVKQLVPGYWLIISFTLTLLVVWGILRKSETSTRLERSSPLNVGSSVGWAIAGVFIAFFAQSIAIQIEYAIGIEMGSENTQAIIGIIEKVPVTMLVAAIIGPILEEIVFRKIIFGVLYEKMNFFFAALISSVIFALAHFEPEHVILYSAMGFTFAFLYVRTKRILVPIFAHVAMNTSVVLIQSIYKDEIQKIMNEAEKIQGFIGGHFL